MGYPGTPPSEPVEMQAQAALQLYARNGGFGPNAWNNSAHCGKGG
jgi:hypothetical protein